MILLEKRFYFYSSILLLLTLNGPEHTSGTVTQTPTTACVGYPVTVNCTLEVPNANDNFFSTLTDFIVGDTDAPIPEANVDGAGTHGGVDLSKLMATAISGNSKSVQGTITLLSYTTGDNGTRLGCANVYSINGNTNDRATVRETLNISQAGVPDNPASINVNTFSLSPTNCTNAMISWTAPDSNIAIQYYVYRGDILLPDNPTSSTQYTDTEQLMVNTPYSYSVIANSCAGNSTGGVETEFNITAHTLDSITSVRYDNMTSTVDIIWILNPGSTPLTLTYSLSLVYSHTRSDSTYNDSDTFSFSLLSNVTTRSENINGHSFTTNDTVVTIIRACIRIVEQCGDFTGQMECGTYNSEIVITTPATNPSSSSSSSIGPKSIPTPSSTIIEGIIIGAGVAAGSLLILSGVIAGAVAIAVMLCQKNGKHGNLQDEEGDQKDTIGMTPKPAELVYAELDLVASKTGGVTHNTEDTHYMAVRPTMDGPNKY